MACEHAHGLLVSTHKHCTPTGWHRRFIIAIGYCMGVMTRKKTHSVTSSPKCIFAGHDPQKNTFCDVITKIIQDITD
jgi:hypothetical protein